MGGPGDPKPIPAAVGRQYTAAMPIGAELKVDGGVFASRWLGDWRDGLHPKIVASAAFLFFACLAPAIAFGGLMSDLTGGQIGAVEMIVATAGCGVAYALLAGQPLTVLGGTGPLLIFTGVLYDLCVRLGLPFLTTYAWVGLWTALLSVLLSLFGAARLIKLFTRFTDETFGALISLIFIVQALADLLANFSDPSVSDSGALFAVLLALGTLTVAMATRALRQSRYLREWPRQFLADFGPAIAVVTMVLARRLLMEVEVNTLAMPAKFATTNGRPWTVDLFLGPAWLPFAAIAPALLVTVLLYMDQNITARLINSPEHRLTKGTSYDWDFALVGVLIAACSMFGLPWLVAATVRSLNHVRSLTTTEVDDAGETRIVSTRENRLSALLIHLLIAGALLLTGPLAEVPMAVLLGLFLYMGVASTDGNQLFERMQLWVLDPKRYPSTHYLRAVPTTQVHLYTFVQSLCLAALWVVKASVAAILFPLLLAGLVLVRRLLPRLFKPAYVEVLDQEEVPADVQERLAE